ncbi:hypothetical protein NDU88_003851 [Pleurodeles waltl]|uniref:Secreted protein n=1 Tax=Pleurodeles waltl TaxID=8319 RepID=A0AAV7LK28_PLEWA|nr:hypothetical protein NDU88_003851 [Pleurodeles waltl]
MGVPVVPFPGMLFTLTIMSAKDVGVQVRPITTKDSGCVYCPSGGVLHVYVLNRSSGMDSSRAKTTWSPAGPYQTPGWYRVGGRNTNESQLSGCTTSKCSGIY